MEDKWLGHPSAHGGRQGTMWSAGGGVCSSRHGQEASQVAWEGGRGQFEEHSDHRRVVPLTLYAAYVQHGGDNSD